MPSLTGSALLNAPLAAYLAGADWIPRHPAFLYVIGLLFLIGGVISIFAVTTTLVENDIHDVELHKAYRASHSGLHKHAA